MPTDSAFADSQRAAKASVILKLRHDTLPKDAVLAISRLVSGAVDELKPEDVSIVDADSDRSLGLSHDGQADGAATEATLAQRLVATLEPVVGVDKIRASVNIDYDQGSTDETQQKYDPTVSALLSEQKSTQQSGPTPAGTTGGPAGGVPGTSSNVPSAQQKTAAPLGPTQSSLSDSTEYGVNKVETHTIMPAGRIQRVTAAIVVDDAIVRNVANGKTTFTRRKRSQDELDRIQQLAEGVIGFDAKRGDTISVQDLAFDSPVNAGDLPAPTLVERAQKTVTDYSSLARPLSLLGLFLLAYLFVLRPIQKQALAPGQPMAQPALPGAPRTDRIGAGPAETIDDTRRAAQLKEQTIELIKQKPANTARAVQAWLREEPS
jgi:flagellar M-ring protein FliF